MRRDKTVIVGAGLAGVRSAQALRSLGYDGDLIMIGAEAHAPYDRPPLSKQILTGQWRLERTALQTENLDVDWRLGVGATALSLDPRTLTLDTGEQLAFDRLVLAGGSRARTLPLCVLAGVHVLRSLDDAVALRADLDDSPSRVVIVGGGFIGAEVASSCRQRGLDVSIIEPLRHPLGRVVGDTVGSCLAAHYRDHKVDLRLGVTIHGWTTDGAGAVRSLHLSDGSELACDVVVVAIGAQPNVEWLHGSGLIIDDGVVCDADLLAAPGVVAVGDLARWPNRRSGEFRRIEHWDNAGRQASHAAMTLLDMHTPGCGFTPVPWVWSDQFERKVQIYGSTVEHDETVIAAGSIRERKFVALYRKGTQLCAALSVNMVRPLLGYRQLLEEDNPSWSKALTLVRTTK
jgi:3-phenylpropionate/trans-cinnamate dioxygenase ferredoxin reductase component